MRPKLCQITVRKSKSRCPWQRCAASGESFDHFIETKLYSIYVCKRTEECLTGDFK